MFSGIPNHNALKHYLVRNFSENAAMHDATRANIRKLMVEHDVKSERQLAHDCNITQSALNRFLKGESETLEFLALQTLAHYFGLTISQLIGETPFEPDPKVRVVTLAMQQMPEYKKDVLVGVSSSLAEPEDKTNGAANTARRK